MRNVSLLMLTSLTWSGAASAATAEPYLGARSFIRLETLSPAGNLTDFVVNTEVLEPNGPITVTKSNALGSTFSSAEFGALKASAKTSGMGDSYIRNFNGQGLFDSPLIYNTIALSFGGASQQDTIAPLDTMRVTNNYSFDRAYNFEFGLNRQLVADTFAENSANPNFHGRLLGSFITTNEFFASFYDLDLETEVARIQISDQTNVNSVLLGAGPEDLSSTSRRDTVVDIYEQGVLTSHVQTTSRFPELSSATGPVNYAAPVDLVAGHRYQVFLDLATQATLTGVYAFSVGAEVSGDAAHSAYWNGITDAVGVDGNQITDVFLNSGSGFDYRYASAQSPNPMAVAPVPLPTSWALLLPAVLTAGLRRKSRRISALH